MKLKGLEKARKVVTSLVVAALVAVAAYAISGVVTRHVNLNRLQLTSGTAFTIMSKVYASTCTKTATAKLYPGVTRCLVISLHNPLAVQIHVTTLSIINVTFTKAVTTPHLTKCTPAWLTKPASLHATFIVTAGMTGTVDAPIALKTTGGNQDNCRTGTFNFTYHAHAYFKDETTTALTTPATPNPSSYGQTVTFTATVRADDATFDTLPLSGTVEFVRCTTHLCASHATLGKAPVNSTVSSPTYGKAVFHYSALPPGKNNIEAIYQGTANYTGSPSQVISQGVGATATNTHLSTGNPNPSKPGQPVTFTATVTPATGSGTPAGKVTLYKCKSVTCKTVTPTPLTTKTLSGGKATFSVTFPSTGTYELKAKFTSSNTTEFLNSGSNVVTQEVAATLVCTKTTHNGGYTVPAGKTVELCGTVNGGLTVKTHATLILQGATINGGVSSTNASAIRFCKSTINGGATINKTGGFVFVGDAKPHDDTPTCTGNTINGGITISNGTGGVELGGDNVSGGVNLVANKAPTGTIWVDVENEVEGNTISGGISCTTNKPAPTYDGKTNSVTGKASGQCSGAGF